MADKKVAREIEERENEINDCDVGGFYCEECEELQGRLDALRALRSAGGVAPEHRALNSGALKR